MADMGIGIILEVHEEDGHNEQFKVQGLFDQASKVIPRKDVVRQVNDGAHLYPLYTDATTKQTKLGERVHVYEVNGQSYLRTTADNTEEDNLGELPKF